ncbi:MAG: hypothetical protein ACRENP_27095 [Longimicrobiales bacterium]
MSTTMCGTTGHGRGTVGRSLRSTMLALVMCSFISPLAAQQPARSGFGMSFGLGWGSAGVTCEDCDIEIEDRTEGLAGYVRIGGNVNARLFVGVEGIGWLKNSDGLERRIAAVSLVTVGYPSATAGFFVRGGFGGVRAVIEDAIFSVTGEGLSWQIGAGFDIPMGAGAALTPYVTYLNSSNVTAHLNEVSLGTNLNPNILLAGLAITVR